MIYHLYKSNQFNLCAVQIKYVRSPRIYKFNIFSDHWIICHQQTLSLQDLESDVLKG